MRRQPFRRHAGRCWVFVALVIVVSSGSLATLGQARDEHEEAAQLTFTNPLGVHRTITTADRLDQSNPFFQDLGTNGRSCFSCHRPAQGWTVGPTELQHRFNETRGLDPIFRNNDGTNCEGEDISTLSKRRAAFSLLLNKGLIRVGLDVPQNAEFVIVSVDDPYHCGTPFDRASMYRRPLPTTNLKFLSTVMWDGRETTAGQAIAADLAAQANGATTGHAQGAPLTPEQRRQIVEFETALTTAQVIDERAGPLRAAGGDGGPQVLRSQPFCIGINDPLGMLPSMPGACASASGFDPHVFTIFTSWERSKRAGRQAILRGERLFNTRTFVIDDVGGLNRSSLDPVPGPIRNGTCTVCHDTPNAGNHSVSLPLDIGLMTTARRTPDLPLYTLQNKTTGETVQTTDPGRAMVTGKWNDISRVKGPILRALAPRAPYFHNGSAATLEDVVDFYNTRFGIGLTEREKADLIAFLGAL